MRRRRVWLLAAVAAAALAAAGLRLLPGRAAPRVVVVAEDPGRSREVMAADVALPLERRLASLPGVRAVESRSEDGRVQLIVATDGTVATDELDLAARRRLDEAAVPRLAVAVVPGAAEPVAEVAVLGGTGPLRTRFVREVLAPALARVPGVGRLAAAGASRLQMAVAPRAAALAARGLTAADVATALRGLGTATPAGRMREGAVLESVWVRQTVRSAAELAALRIDGPAGRTPLAEVADLAPRETTDGSWYRRDGAAATLLLVFPAAGEEGPAVAREVRRRATDLAAHLAPSGGLRLVAAEPGSRAVVRFELPAGLSREAERQAGERLERAVRVAVAGLRPTFASALFRRAADDPEPGLDGLPGAADPADPAFDQPRGRLELGFADAETAARARTLLARALAGLAEGSGAWVEAAAEASEPLDLWALALTPEGAAALAENGARAVALCGRRPLPDPALSPRPRLRLAWDEAFLAASGSGRPALAEPVRAGLGELDLGTVEIPGVEPELRLAPTQTSAESGLDLLPVRFATAAAGTAGPARPAPLAALARSARLASPPPLVRRDGRPAARLRFAPGDRFGPAELAACVAGVAVPPGGGFAVGDRPVRRRR